MRPIAKQDFPFFYSIGGLLGSFEDPNCFEASGCTGKAIQSKIFYMFFHTIMKWQPPKEKKNGKF